jgi:hypothetical protein
LLYYVPFSYFAIIVGVPGLGGLAMARVIGRMMGGIGLVNFVRQCLEDAATQYGYGGEQEWFQWLCEEFSREGRRLQKEADSNLVKMA